MDLGKLVLDKQLLDSSQRRCGKVDDLVLAGDGDELPEVAGILTQQGALARDMGTAVLRIVNAIYRLLGMPNPKPIFIPWNLVEKIDVVVHLRETRQELSLDRLQGVISERIIGKIPGS